MYYLILSVFKKKKISKIFTKLTLPVSSSPPYFWLSDPFWTSPTDQAALLAQVWCSPLTLTHPLKGPVSNFTDSKMPFPATNLAKDHEHLSQTHPSSNFNLDSSLAVQPEKAPEFSFLLWKLVWTEWSSGGSGRVYRAQLVQFRRKEQELNGFFLTYHDWLCFKIMVSDFNSKSISIFSLASSFILAPKIFLLD